MTSYRLGPVKLYAFARRDSITMMNRNTFPGAFRFIIASEGGAVREKNPEFKKLKNYVQNLPRKRRVVLLKKCRSISERLGSPKRVGHWDAKLADES